MDILEQLQTLDQQTVEALARQVLERDDLAHVEWRAVRLKYAALNEVSGGLFRLYGTANAGPSRVPWSLVLKIVHAPTTSGPLGRSDDPAHYNYWKREPLAYVLGVLPHDPSDVRAPRCFGVIERSPEVFWIWLEDVRDSYDTQWVLPRYHAAARHFGRFNGSYLVNLHTTERTMAHSSD